MAKARKNAKKIVSVKYEEHFLYELELLVPASMTKEDLEELCYDWPNRMIRQIDPLVFDLDIVVGSECRLGGPSLGHNFEMIRKDGRWKYKYYDEITKQNIEV